VLVYICTVQALGSTSASHAMPSSDTDSSEPGRPCCCDSMKSSVFIIACSALRIGRCSASSHQG
jgi:hypothetical protein